MIHYIFLQLAPGLLSHIVVPALRTGILAGLAGLALALFRPKSISVRVAVWTMVLYAALAMPFLSWLLPAVRLPLHVPHRQRTPAALTAVLANAASSAAPMVGITSSPVAIPAARRTAPSPAAESLISHPNALAEPQSTPVPATNPFLPADFWALLFTGGYFLAVAVLLGRFAAGQVLSRRLRNRATPVNDSRARALLDRYGQALGVDPAPSLSESQAIAVPATLGLRNPTILLPLGWRSWDGAKLGAVLAHELSHVKRRDAWTFALSAIHEGVFCFSPLAWWLDRKLKDLAEEASDEAALCAGADATDYAELLLGFFTTLARAGRRVHRQAISIAQGSRAERRLDRILHAGPAVRFKKARLAIIFCCAAPAVCLIAAVRPCILRAAGASAAPAKVLQQVAPSAPPAAQSAKPAPAANPAASPTAAEYQTSRGPQERRSALPTSATTLQLQQRAQQAAPLPAMAVPAAPARMLQQVAPSAPPAAQSAKPAPAANPAASPTAAEHQTSRGPQERRSALPTPAPAAPNPQSGPPVFPKGVRIPPPPPTPPENPTPSVPIPARLAALPSPPTPAAAPQPPQTVLSTTSFSSSGNSSWFFDANGGPDYAVVSGNSFFMSGSEGERGEVKALRAQIKGDFIWFRRNGKSYIIQDPATVKEAAELFRSEEELGRQQAALGKQQAMLGQTQANLGNRISAVRLQIPADLLSEVKQVEAAAQQIRASTNRQELRELETEAQQLGSRANQQKLGRLEDELGRLQGELGHLQGELGRLQAETHSEIIGQEMSELGRAQGTLGREQGRLGREQSRLARQANRQMRRLIDNAFNRGLAKPAPATK